ncbi:hypothetical protein ACFV0O_28590 [Kitasatospora sp. NPDC059577]|uniref:hypothetical protein n=1 Tax=unclassified Kitasatospora TaxID=2633591 RepID=UPI00368824A4
MTDRPAFAPSLKVLCDQPGELTAPDVSLAGLLAQFPGLAEAKAICLTGSTAAGWANPFSDVDAYAFADTDLDLPVDDTMEMWRSTDESGLTCLTWMGRYGDSRIDLKIWPTDAPAQALAPYLTAEEPEFCESGTVVKDFVYRLSIAKPLKGEEFFEETSRLIASSSYQRALTRTLKIDAENRLTDVAGMLRNDDVKSARIAAMTAAAWIADGALVLAGSLCRSDKWLLRRIEETPASGLTVDGYRTQVLQGPGPGESERDCVLRIANWARTTVTNLEEAALG